MSDSVTIGGAPIQGSSKSFSVGSAIAFFSIAVGFGYYIPLLGLSYKRPDVFLFFVNSILPWALGHTAALLILSFAFKLRARGSLIFWVVSIIPFVYLGGLSRAKGLTLAFTLAIALMALGRLLSRLMLDECSGSWAVSLALGILSISFISSWLVWAHLLKWWVIGPILIVPLYLKLRHFSKARVLDSWGQFCAKWNLGLAVALQGLFLLTIFGYVYSVAPEVQADALRSYLPYVRAMHRVSGFIDLPQIWAYIIPQAGLTYAASVMTLFGETVLPLTSFLVWLTLIGIVCRKKGSAPLELRLALALIIASSPVVLWVATSLMQDCFVSLVVVVLAILCLEGKDPGSWKFWAAIGLGIGLAWAAKYSTLAYAGPLLICATFRSWRSKGLLTSALGLCVAGLSALGSLLPWLVHSYRLSGNPVFPLLLNIFPARLWPRGVGFSNLDRFRLPPGPRGWFYWLIDLTYNTSRFVEGFDGKLGITLLVLFLMALLVLWKGTGPARALIVCSICGTAGLISMTAYLRYWMPGLWLVALVVPPVLAMAVRTPRSRFCISLAAIAFVTAHAFMVSMGHWADRCGWPWKFYSQKIALNDQLADTFRGFDMLSRVQDSWQPWPKIWQTGFEGSGHLRATPLEAVIWELLLHVKEPRAIIQYLASAGCAYWIMNNESDDSKWLRAAGVASFFWDDKYLVASQGHIRIYRLRSEAEVLNEFDQRASPGCDLLVNGGFESGVSENPLYWVGGNPFQWNHGVLGAEEGSGYLRLGPGGSVRQFVTLPPGLQAMELEVAAKGAGARNPTSMRWNIVFKGVEKNPSPLKSEASSDGEYDISSIAGEFKAGAEWKHHTGDRVAVPSGALIALIYLENVDAAENAAVDTVHLYSRK